MHEEHKQGDPFCGEGRVVNSGPELDNLTSEEARRKLLRILGEQGVGGEYTNYRLRDWLISRQRYTHTHHTEGTTAHAHAPPHTRTLIV